MPARPEGGTSSHPSEILQIPPSATREQVEEAYLHCIARLRSAFLNLGGFDSLPTAHNQTLDTFVCGDANALALSACQRVCDAPGHIFNPLYLYGRPGLGKSHLLAALHHGLRQRRPELLVVSTTAERFTEELLLAMGNHLLDQFHNKYREVDVLLVDSLHLLSNRLRTQEELCAVLDHLMACGRQVVLASQSPPKDSAGLLDSLRSRLSSGLVVEIGYPDLETRKSIVRLLAEQAGLGLSREVVFTLAHRIQHDVRELKGAVMRLLAHRQRNARVLQEGTRLSLDELLYDLAPVPRNEGHSLEEVLEQVTAFYQIEPNELLTRRNTKKVKRARQIGMYLARILTTASLQEIGDALGASANQVLYAVKTVKQNLDDPMVSGDLESLHERLGGEPAPKSRKTERASRARK